jgi:signal transduction histidine kinase
VAEGITNALKHAAANQITVDVRAEGDGLRIEVADDGTGTATPGTRPLDDAVVGRGLSSLTDRVTSLGGQVTITSRPGQGTTLLAVL